MATVVSTWMPTPTSFTLVRPLADCEAEGDSPTFTETIQTVNTPPEPEGDDSSRFRPLRLFATGGQGLVYVAHDNQLGREVALKELKPRNAERKLSRHRFIREAEITGSLEHPGVVPVYSLGRHADGRPYYVMRLIQGRTLHDAIQQFYAPELKVTPIERNLLFRKLLQRLVNVCQTVAYAHSRGILHRDLKPANILLGQYGEALVADWGLARPFHATGGCDSDPELPIEPDPGDPPSNATLMGSALGTPAFMSPEQSEGRWDKVGPPSDVYSLGATMYTILTGQSPLPKMAWVEAHRRITTGDIPSPKLINPNAPRGLVAICRKAMAVSMANRYQTALALAEDIEHWLADEPVTAEPAPFAERVSRWVRRHRTLVWAMGVLWLTGGLALGVGLVVVDGWRQSNVAAHKRTRNSLERSQSRIVDDWLGQQPELLPEHRQYLTEMLTDFESLAADTESDPSTRLAVVRAYRRVGEIKFRLGEHSAAAEAIGEAEQRVKELTDVPETRFERATLLGSRGMLENVAKPFETAAERNERLEKAERKFGQSVTSFTAIVSEAPHAAAHRALAAAHNNHAVTLSELKRYSQATKAFQSALQMRQKLIDDGDSGNEAIMDLSRAFTALGECLRKQDDKIGAESNFLEAATIAGPLVDRRPSHAPYREVLATATLKLGRLYLSQKNANDAGIWLAIASDHYDQLSYRYPGIPEYAIESASALNHLGNIAMDNKDAETGLTYFNRATEALRPLEKRESTARIDSVVRAVKAGLANALGVAGRYAEAVDAWEAAAVATPAKADEYRSHQALQLLHCNRVPDAIRVAEDVVRMEKRCNVAIYNCACVYSQAAVRDAESATTYKRRAVELLQQVADRGYFKNAEKIKELDKDSDIAPLKSWPEYEAFRAKLDQ